MRNYGLWRFFQVFFGYFRINSVLVPVFTNLWRDEKKYLPARLSQKCGAHRRVAGFAIPGGVCFFGSGRNTTGRGFQVLFKRRTQWTAYPYASEQQGAV